MQVAAAGNEAAGRVFVTGVQGFTGRYVAEVLQGRGYQVHGLIRSGGGPAPAEVVGHAGDLRDLSRLTEIIASIRPSAVLHLAGIAFVAHGNIGEIYEANLVGSRNLLQAIVDAAAAPSAVLLASSANVYGNSRDGALDENTPPDPANDYGVSKLAMEFAARLFRGRLPLIVARPFNYTGVGQSEQFLIPKIVAHVRARADGIELGNIDVERDFSDVRVVAEAYARLVAEPRAVGGTFNICSGEGRSLRSVLDAAEAISGHRMQLRVNPAFVRPNEVPNLYGSNQRLLDTIGELNMPPFHETLRWMIER